MKKVRFYFFIYRFLHTFGQKRTFCYTTTFVESLITHKRFVFEESYISYGKRQKSCTLIVIFVKCLYLTSPIFNTSAKSNSTSFLPGGKYFVFLPRVGRTMSSRQNMPCSQHCAPTPVIPFVILVKEADGSHPWPRPDRIRRLRVWQTRHEPYAVLGDSAAWSVQKSCVRFVMQHFLTSSSP